LIHFIKTFILDTITSLKQLREALPHCSGQEYVKIADQMEIPVSDFEPFAFFNEEHYTRNCIDRTDDYELLLLCWEPGQVTPIHGHGGEECWVYDLQGTILEKRQEWNEKAQEIEVIDTTVMSEGQISYMNDHMGFHSLHNTGEDRAMTLHLYMNPIDRCDIYDSEKNDFETRELHYYTHQGELLEVN